MVGPLRLGTFVVAALALGWPALAQQQEQCESMLMQSSAAMNSNCCGAGSTCVGGVPSACDARCATTFMPFWTMCSSFVQANLPELVSFGQMCETSQGNTPVPPPPAGGSGSSYLRVTFQLQAGTVGASAKRQARFESNFRSDLGAALNVNPSAVVIAGLQGDSVTVEIFATSGAGAMALQQALQTQLADPQSDIMTGTTTAMITNGQAAQITMSTAGAGPQCGEAAWCAPNCCATLDGGGDGDGTFNVFVDNSFTAYVNGQEVGSSGEWATHSYHFDAPCEDGNVYAIHGVDTGGPSAIIASVDNGCGSTTTTGPNWKCTSDEPGDGWNDQGFDASSWDVAISGGLNGAPPWGVRPGIDLTSHWIWAHDLLGTDEVWCRITTGSHDYDDGMYAATEGHDNGQMHVGADDSAIIYVNGERIGDTSVDQWDQTERFAFTAPCASPTTYAFEVTDDTGAAMLIATINHCGEVSNTNPARWKCSSSCEDGWEASGFDDSAWPFATSMGVNGNPPYSRHEVDDDAYYIWNSELGQHGVLGDDKGFDHDNRMACCRYVSDHRAINCNAARMRYTQDYLAITQCGYDNMIWDNQGDSGQWCNQDGLGNQGYDAAYAHFTQTGEASGYIWHSELCNPDGSDIVVDQDCSIEVAGEGEEGNSGQVTCGAVHGIAYFAVDNGYDFYVNDEHIGSGNDWTTTDRFTFEASCDENTVYGIDAYDEGGIASILGTIYHCGEMILTSSAWKCAPLCQDPCTVGADGQETCGTGIATVGCTDTTFWTQPDGELFHDRYWAPAADAGDNGVGPWGHRPDVSGEAHWIWSADSDGHDEVRCRYETSHQAIECPAAQARYWQDYNDVAAADVAAADVAGSIGMEAWDHYQRYGQNSGTIWHSELCNADGTNKRSPCERKHTSDQYEYNFLSEPLGDDKTITFSVKANNDAHVGFFNNQEHSGEARNVQDQYTIDLGAQYEIVICGWGGTQSVIREEAQGDAKALTDTTGYLDPDDYRQFWASAANGLVRVGAGNDVGTHTFLVFQDPNDILDVNWAAVATGWGSEGDWVVCIPEKCTGTHDAVTAELSGMEVCDGCGNGCDGLCNPRDCGSGTAGCPNGQATASGNTASSEKFGFSGGGMVNPVNEAGDTMTFHLAACKAGPHSIGWVYQLAPGTRGGLTNVRQMALTINSVQIGNVDFPATGGWQSGDWREVFSRVQLSQGENIISLTTTGSEGPNFDSIEVNSVNGGTGIAASSHGVIHITADNGYILYVNGDRIGAGGSSLGAAHGQHTDWTHTDAWTFVDQCDTPTTYAIHALDSEGIAAVIGDFTHCGQTIVTGDQWRCAPITSMTASDHGGMHLDGSSDKQYIAGPVAMDYIQARQYCQQNYDDLASIHSAEEQSLAWQACQDAGHDCWIGMNDQFREGRYTWADGTTVDFMNWAPGEPNNYNEVEGDDYQYRPGTGDEDAVMLYLANGLWNDEIEVGGPEGFVNEQGACFLRQQCVLGDMAHECTTDATGAQTCTNCPEGECNPGNAWEVYMKNDGYTRHVGYNAWTGHGASDDSEAILDHTPASCQALCTADATCDCIVFQVGQGKVPLCETSDSIDEVALDGSLGDGQRIQYLGCFVDDLDGDGDGQGDCGQTCNEQCNVPGVGGCTGPNCAGFSQGCCAGDCRDLSGAVFHMGEEASPHKCAELCAGYAYFGLQDYNQCFCDNAGGMTQRAPEAECDTPCSDGIDHDADGAPAATMCGGAWRNSVYQLSTTFWEMPGFDDRGWQAAADLGINGVAPWNKRPSISENAHWMWTADAGVNHAYNQNNFQDNTPGASLDEAGNCFLRQQCDLSQMTHGTTNCPEGNCNPGATWEVHMKNDGYIRRPGYNAWTDHGATDDSDPIPGVGLGECQNLCNADDSCDCIVYQVGFQQEGHDNIFCRFTQPNQEINCYAAQAKYMEDNPDAKDNQYPAWLHYVDIGKAEGRAWPSDLCNTCTETTRGGTGGGITTQCDASVYNQQLGQCFNQGSTTDGAAAGGTAWMDNNQAAGVNGEQYVEAHGQEGFYTYEEGLTCTDKCRGIHDAAVADMVGATSCHLQGDVCHGGHYGLGFANFQNPTGDTVTFRLHMCNAGRHRIAISYALANDDPPRPLGVQVNGVSVGAVNEQTGQTAVGFPATGDWTTWGKVYVEGMLLDGDNTVVLTAIQNSGPNIDSIEIFPHDDHEIGTAFVDVDNEYSLYIDSHLVGSGSQWDSTDAFNFQASCDTPTVYAIHGIDYEVDAGTAGAGIVAEFTHCGEIIRTSTRWKCIASDLQNGAPPPPEWMQPTFDDSAWQVATSYGRNGDSGNYWYTHMERPADEIGPGAQWIWTSDGSEDPMHPGSAHNDVFCRYVSNHDAINCKAAADRYKSDYPRHACRSDYGHASCDPFAHFKESGELMGRIWHSELCEEDCTYTTAPFDWIDATRGSPLPLGDDDQVQVDLPFPFPFYGQVKTSAIISSNGFLTFSGDHHTTIPGQNLWGGESLPIPSAMNPNDMIAPFWADLNPTTGGGIYTATTSHCARGISNGNVCCAATCGQCGGSGCQNRLGGRAACCSGTVRDSAVRCQQNGGNPPCISDGNAFTVEWADVPYYAGGHAVNAPIGQQGMYSNTQTDPNYAGGTNHFELTLYSDGKIKFQYKDMTPSPNAWSPPSVGVENAAGSEGMQISYDDPTFPLPNTAFMFGKTCGRSQTVFSIGWCPNYCPGGDAANCPGVTVQNTCDYDYGDRFCQDNYGGQLASMEDQEDYNRVRALIPNDQVANQFGTITGNEKYMLGLHADPRSCGTGQPVWDYTDGTPADMDFLSSHSQDGLTCEVGGSNHLVYTASYETEAGRAGCDPAHGCGLHDCCTGSIISGFVCEYYAAPGSIGIGLAQAFDDAEEMCQTEFGGHLLSIHDQQTMNKLTTLTTGYTNPVLIGLRSDSAGNWEWADGSPTDMDFLRDLSADGLAGVNENQAVIFGGEIHDWGQRNGATADGGPFAYACGAWGHCAVPSTECNPLAHCNTCETGEDYSDPANVNDCLTCQAGYQFVDIGSSDCTGTCEPLLDGASHYIGGTNLNNQNGANGEYTGYSATAVWSRASANTRVPDPQELRCCANPWEWRGGEKTLEQCRTECLSHAECVGIEFCGPDDGHGKHDCDQNECILLSSTLDGAPAQGWNIYVHSAPGQPPPGGGH